MYSQFQHRPTIQYYIIWNGLSQNLTKTELIQQQQQQE